MKLQDSNQKERERRLFPAKQIQVMRDGRPATKEELEAAVEGLPLPAAQEWDEKAIRDTLKLVSGEDTIVSLILDLQKQMNAMICQCGHANSEHAKLTTFSPNYTAGPCKVTGCKCEHFVIASAPNEGGVLMKYPPRHAARLRIFHALQLLGWDEKKIESDLSILEAHDVQARMESYHDALNALGAEVEQLRNALIKVRGYGRSDMGHQQLCDYVTEVADEALRPYEPPVSV